MTTVYRQMINRIHGKGTSSNARTQDHTPIRNTNPVYSSNTELGSAMIGGIGKGLFSTAVLASAMKIAGAPMQAISNVVPESLTRNLPTGMLGNVTNKADIAEKAGLYGKLSSFGESTFSLLSAGVPMLGNVTGIWGAFIGDRIGDALNIREGETLRDAVEDNSTNAKNYKSIVTNMNQYEQIARENELAAIGLEIEGLGFLGRSEDVEAKYSEGKESKSWADSIAETAAEKLNAVASNIAMEGITVDSFEGFGNLKDISFDNLPGGNGKKDTLFGKTKGGRAGGSGNTGFGGSGAGWAGGDSGSSQGGVGGIA